MAVATITRVLRRMVMIERVTKSDTKYLDLNNVREFVEEEYLAYVQDVVIGETRYNDGFIKFFLKDCNSNVVVARLFNVEDFMLSGVNTAAFKRKPVVFRGVAQPFNGSISLVISGKYGIKVYDGEFDYSRFIGSVKSNLLPFYDALANADIEYSPNPEWETMSLGNVAGGRAGGFAKLVEVSFGCIAPFVQEEDKELVPAFYVTMEHYYRYLKDKQSTSVVGYLDTYDYAMQINAKYSEDNSKLLYLDAFNSVVGSKKPRHFYAHLIKNAVDFATVNLGLQIRFSTQLLATTSSIGGVELSKY